MAETEVLTKKKRDDSQGRKNRDIVDSRLIFVGDDTGLLKKLKMNLRVVDNVIVEPSKRKIRNKRTLQDMKNEEQSEGDEDERKSESDRDSEDEEQQSGGAKRKIKTKYVYDEGIVRDKAECTLKLVDKYGT